MKHNLGGENLLELMRAMPLSTVPQKGTVVYSLDLLAHPPSHAAPHDSSSTADIIHLHVPGPNASAEEYSFTFQQKPPEVQNLGWPLVMPQIAEQYQKAIMSMPSTARIG